MLFLAPFVVSLFFALNFQTQLTSKIFVSFSSIFKKYALFNTSFAQTQPKLPKIRQPNKQLLW